MEKEGGKVNKCKENDRRAIFVLIFLSSLRKNDGELSMINVCLNKLS